MVLTTETMVDAVIVAVVVTRLVVVAVTWAG